MATKPSVLPPGIVPIPEDVRRAGAAAVGQWLARQGQETQDYYLWKNPDQNSENGAKTSQLAQVAEALYKERAAAYRAGELLPGVNETGEGIPGKYLGGEAKSRSLQAAGQGRVNEVADSVSQNPEDYTVHANLDQGPGYNLADRMTTLGQALPLDQQLQLDAISQGRSDTTGIDAQHQALGGFRDIYAQGGLTAQDRARIAQSQQIRGAEARGNEQAIRANAEEQGRAGGRLSYLLSQQAQQRSINQRSLDDLQTEALAEARRERALEQQGSIGNQIQTAQDMIDKFNTEDQRAMRDTGNQARESTWNENNRRESVNAGIKNSAAQTQYGADIARSGQNTDRLNTAEQINKGPSGGARGLFRDRLAGAEASAGHDETGAALLNQQEALADQLSAEKYNGTVSAIAGGAGAIGDIATAGLESATKKKAS